ncbi:PAS domain-containing sensor histidine kinase [Mucilaginibacter ginsenosidivorans]|uniref:histidine kinase n=1 Tax=Mucilaginibacter ginsenosidivorans TaxID=398053 RepID=A0A5B8UVZ2_9SPHI|nr:PAS domain-containing sensor histidine kinase [Mucilaginibacter ginsenosidivorans]QEC63123.1 PAS domain S-box protein [Mucilaginibacter ginsenosidivorans]
MMDFVLKSEGTDKSTVQHTAEELEQTIKKYRALISSSNTGAWEYFPKADFLDCNSVYFSMLGREINDYDLSGRKNLDSVWAELIHPEDRMEAVSCFFDYLVNPIGMYESFFRMKHADGSWVWICSRGSSLKDETTGKITSLIGTNVDVTGQKKAESDIQSEKILLRTLIDNLPDTIYVKDAEGRKIIANKADVACIGLNSEADVIGKNDIELFPGEIGERGYSNDMEVLSGKPQLNKEEFFFDKDGKERWLSTSKVPVYGKSGVIDRILGIGHDITERKRSEEALKKLNEELNAQSDELKVLNGQILLQKEQELEKAIAQGKFEIASEVLHDIGNALVGFGSYLNRINRATEKNSLDALKNLNAFLKNQHGLLSNAIGEDKANALVTITDGISKTQAENQKEISTSVGELLHIVSHIQEILNIQRQLVRNHGASHERKPVNLVDLLDNCRSMLLASMEKKGVKLSVNIKAGNHVIKGDHTKLMQVILNVMKNSLEAINMEAEGKCISISLDSADKHIELKITDNGQGFDEETSQKFFQRGFTTKKSGTGLGLYNCRSIVESHAGTFDISSEGPGLGSVTTIKFAI